MSDTFSDRYVFVGPSIPDDKPSEETPKKRKQIYISLGTVLNQNVDFYKNCIQAFKGDSQHSLNEAVKIVLYDESFKKNAAKLGASLKKAGGARTAAIFIESKL